METFEKIIRALVDGPTGLYYLMALGSVFSTVFWGLRKILVPKRKGDKSLAFLADKATGFRAVLDKLYGRGVDGFLEWIDRRAKDDYLNRAEAGTGSTSPWSTGLYDFTLLLAVAYPLLFLVAGWAINGLPPPGLEAIVAAEPSGLKRAAGVVGLGFFVVMSVKGFRSEGRRSLVYLAFALAFAFAFALTFAGAVAVAVAVAIIVKRLEKERAKIIFYAVHGFILLLGILAVLAFLDFGGRSRNLLQLAVFLGLLPLANAPLDWASLGLTRGLLRFGRGKGLLRWEAAMSGVDLVCALLIMVLLAAVTAAVISVANGVGPQPVLPLGPIFEGLREAPGDPRNWWIYLMMASTLIPTAAHMLAGLAALVVASMKWLFDAVEKAKEFIDTDGEGAATDGMVLYGYPALGALGVTALVFLLSLLWWFFPSLAVASEWFGWRLLDVAEGADELVRGGFEWWGKWR